ncbi:SDR family oxidoreductase [Candidatus Sumerlaeota bacterium]|nr:SDR family oxidoreductase [Candidatus Sumerlaeota bacterium]
MGRRVLVTGSSTGIGAATALRFAEPDATVGIHYCHSEKPARDVLAGVEKKGATGILLQGDLSRPEPCEAIVKQFLAEAGGIDVLVNNAGALVRRCPVEEMEWDLLDEIFRLNVFSAFMVTRWALPALKESDDPAIVNVGSIAERHGAPTATAYGAAKSGIGSFTRGLAKEAGPKIRVNCVAPGVIETPFHEKVSTPERMKMFAEMAALKRNATADEVAEAIWFLCSAGARFITGETLDVNGGAFMH